MAHKRQFEDLKIQLEAIKSATNNFADGNCIGRGGFGKVYKGEIVHSNGDSTVAALKRLNRAFGQGDPEFWKEIMMLSFYRHPNIVSLLGYCDDCGENILVYEYAPKGSLDSYLNNDDLTWVRRLNICIGAACGLAYLHSPSDNQLRVLHRDIKSSNILLDENWNAMISDFGLSKFGPANQQFTFLISNAVGTPGYCDPLYAETGLLTKESDVFSFGVVLFEVLCGRLCISYNNDKVRPLIGLARQCYEQNTLDEIIYSNLKDEIHPDSLNAFTAIAYQCLKRDREARPSMMEIVRALETALEHQVANMHLWQNTLEKPVLSMKRTIGILNVKVLRAMNLKKKNLMGTSDPYTKLRLTGDELQFKETSLIRKTLNPKWYEEFNLDVKDHHVQALEIMVYHWKRIWKHDKMGMNVVPLKDLTPEVPKILTLDLLMNVDSNDTQNEESQGQILVEVVYKPIINDRIRTRIENVSGTQKVPVETPEAAGVFTVQLHEGENLGEEDQNDLVVRLIFQGEKRETWRTKNKRDPKWGSIFPYRLQKPPTNERLHLEVVSLPTSWMARFQPEECVGYVDIDLTDVANNTDINARYHLVDSKNGWLHVELKWRTHEQIDKETPIITGLLKFFRG